MLPLFQVFSLDEHDQLVNLETSGEDVIGLEKEILIKSVELLVRARINEVVDLASFIIGELHRPRAQKLLFIVHEVALYYEPI